MPLGAELVPRPDAIHVSTFSHNGIGDWFHGMRVGAPASAAWPAANRVLFAPFHVQKPYPLSRWWWLSGAAVGVEYFEMGIYDPDFQLVAASPRVLSAGTASTIQYASPGIHGTNVTASSTTTDQDTYTTASVTLKAGVLYLMAVENSHGSSAVAVSSIDSATGGYPTFTSRATGQYNGTIKRVSIWSAVPTADFTGTLRINFGASSGTTGCVWSLNAFRGVDTASSDGIVQAASIATGTSVTPSVTLSAYGSANNVGFAAFGQAANSGGAPTTAANWELSDTTISATPVQAMQTLYGFNDTTLDETISSVAWGAIAVEIKSLGTGTIIIPPMKGWIASWCSNTTTATFFRTSSGIGNEPFVYAVTSSPAGLPEIATPITTANLSHTVLGFTSRSTP